MKNGGAFACGYRCGDTFGESDVNEVDKCRNPVISKGETTSIENENVFGLNSGGALGAPRRKRILLGGSRRFDDVAQIKRRRRQRPINLGLFKRHESIVEAVPCRR